MDPSSVLGQPVVCSVVSRPDILPQPPQPIVQPPPAEQAQVNNKKENFANFDNFADFDGAAFDSLPAGKID